MVNKLLSCQPFWWILDVTNSYIQSLNGIHESSSRMIWPLKPSETTSAALIPNGNVGKRELRNSPRIRCITGIWPGNCFRHIHYTGTQIISIPIGSMYGIFTHIHHKNKPNVAKYTIHGSYIIWLYMLPIFPTKKSQHASDLHLMDLRSGLLQETLEGHLGKQQTCNEMSICGAHMQGWNTWSLEITHVCNEINEITFFLGSNNKKV